MNKTLGSFYTRTALGAIVALAIAWHPAWAVMPPENRSGMDTTLVAPLTDSSTERFRPAPQGPQQPPVEKQFGDQLFYFVFAAIGDPHIRVPGSSDARYIKAMDKCQELLANYVGDINAHAAPVDFAVNLGDLTDLGKPEEFTAAKQITDSLRCPLYSVLGNHDNFQSDGKRAWKSYAGRDSATYDFDYRGFHFIVIDCTLNPYSPPYVDCNNVLRTWVAQNLAANSDKPTIVFSHFNMWQRPWNAMFDTTLHYAEYRGMPELRQILEDAGNVVAVINGHVHANRVEQHNGIYYVDIAATLVGPPSIRYFYVFPDKIEVTYAYISDPNLFDHVTDLCDQCCCCFSPSEVCAFVDGQVSDKQFTIPLVSLAAAPPATTAPPLLQSGPLALALRRDQAGRLRAVVSSGLIGPVDFSLHDVLGRKLDRASVWKDGPEVEADLTGSMARLRDLPAGIYFIRASLRGAVRTQKFVFVP
jgi:predicted phosphodiesterase